MVAEWRSLWGIGDFPFYYCQIAPFDYSVFTPKEYVITSYSIHYTKLYDGSGMKYSILVIPGNRKMAPQGGERMSIEVAGKLLELLNDGATILMQQKPTKTISLNEDRDRLTAILDEMFSGTEKSIALNGEMLKYIQKGKGRLIFGSFENSTFEP